MSEAAITEAAWSQRDLVPSVERSLIARGPREVYSSAAEQPIARPLSIGKRRDRDWSSSSGGLTAVAPGQLWVVELSATEPSLSPLEYRVITTANVVIYDRLLAPMVAKVLPLGGYAEPASSSGERRLDQAWERCLRFARNGWSVVRLVEHSPSPQQRFERIQCLTERLMAAEVPTNLPVLLFADEGGDTCEKTEAHLGALSLVTSAHSIERRLSIAFTTISAEVLPHLSAASSNGLAG